MTKIVITQPLPATITQQFQTFLGQQVEVSNVTTTDEAEFIQKAVDAQILVNGYRAINAKLLAHTPQVRFIQQLGVGYDNLKLEDLAQLGISAANTPGCNTEAVAEMTITLMLAALKQVSRSDHMTRANQWGFQTLTQFGIGDLAGATVGLIGFGAIGQATAQRLKAFGSQLLYTARHRVETRLEEELGVSYVSLAELLAASHIVSLHLPLANQTRHLIGAKELAQMLPGSILINTARGAIVDETALRQALENGHLAGAALDVLENERDGGNPFKDLPQVLVTPHIGGLSRAALGRTMVMAMRNIKRYVAGEQPLHLL